MISNFAGISILKYLYSIVGMKVRMRAVMDRIWTTMLPSKRAFVKIRIRISLIELTIIAWTPWSFFCRGMGFVGFWG